MRGRHKTHRGTEQAAGDGTDAPAVKIAKPVKKSKASGPARMFERMLSNPDFGYQCMVILLTLTQDNVHMDRRIDKMTSSVDTLRNVTGVVNNAMQSLKTAADAPKQIRKLVGPREG